MRLLLDTHALIWWLAADDSLSLTARNAIADAANDIFISAASAWEIAVKYASGRLQLPEHPERFVPAMREERGFTALAVDEESALHASRLPSLHRDPFDRLLVSQAIVHGMTILTPDPIVARYPARTLW